MVQEENSKHPESLQTWPIHTGHSGKHQDQYDIGYIKGTVCHVTVVHIYTFEKR